MSGKLQCNDRVTLLTFDDLRSIMTHMLRRSLVIIWPITCNKVIVGQWKLLHHHYLIRVLLKKMHVLTLKYWAIWCFEIFCCYSTNVLEHSLGYEGDFIIFSPHHIPTRLIIPCFQLASAVSHCFNSSLSAAVQFCSLLFHLYEQDYEKEKMMVVNFLLNVRFITWSL